MGKHGHMHNNDNHACLCQRPLAAWGDQVAFINRTRRWCKRLFTSAQKVCPLKIWYAKRWDTSYDDNEDDEKDDDEEEEKEKEKEKEVKKKKVKEEEEEVKKKKVKK